MLTDLSELKSVLDIDPDNAAEDKKLNFLAEQASSWIEEWLDRELAYKVRTEYYGGTGTQELLLRNRPVFASPTVEVYVDETGYYGSPTGSFDSTTKLTYGDDFALELDPAGGGRSRSGMLVKINDVWPRPQVRQRGLLSPFVGRRSYGNVKVVYGGGYPVDEVPLVLRDLCNLLVAKLRMTFPLGVELGSEGYEERSISVVTSQKLKLMATVAPMLEPFRNRSW